MLGIEYRHGRLLRVNGSEDERDVVKMLSAAA